MKASRARELLGKRIRWTQRTGLYTRPYTREVVLVEITGRNAVDSQGNHHWLPSIPNVVEVVE